MSYPDFRSTERGYQLMAQVAGRAGRKDVPGKVIIQTRQPDAPVMNLVRRNDYESFYQNQMEERCAFGYPPYTRIVTVTVKGAKPEEVDRTSLILRNELAAVFGEQKVLGPDAPAVARIMYRYLRRIIIKLPLELTVNKSRSLLSKALDSTLSQNVNGITVSFDPDPQ